MTAAALAPDNSFRQAFESFNAGRREPDALYRQRQQALLRFEKLGLPTNRQEAWRFTDVSALNKVHFARAGDAPVDADALPALEGHVHRLVFINGRFARGLSRLQSLPDQALVASVGQALRTHPELIQAHLDQIPGLTDHPFAALNSAFWEDGAFVYLPRGVELAYPLHIVCYSSGAETMSYPRHLIVLEEGAQATVVEDYSGEKHCLHCPVTDIRLGADAGLTFHKIQDASAEDWHLGGLRLQQARASRFDSYHLSLGGPLTRTDVAASLDGPGAECLLTGLTLAGDGELGDQHLRIEHTSPQAHSRQLFKNVLTGKGRTVFDGMIHVRQDAQQTEAVQTNRNLLLSREALAHSNPRLEILADDVKCSHGSTTGFLEPDALFYLRSRGISLAEAQALLVFAFANDCIERIRLPALRERLENVLRRRLHADSSTR